MARFETFILILIILSSMMLVVGTYYKTAVIKVENPGLALAFTILDIIFTALFTLECMVKIVRNGFFVSQTSYLRDSWSILDFVIVITSLIDLSLESVQLPILKVQDLFNS